MMTLLQVKSVRRFAQIQMPEINKICGYLCNLWMSVSLVMFTTIAPAGADSLGRIFFTPQQRTQLDYAYASSNTGGQGSASVLTINGIVQKKGGARTVWINGVARNAGRSDERTPESLTIAVPGKSQPVKAKVGQKILLEQATPGDEEKLDQ